MAFATVWPSALTGQVVPNEGRKGFRFPLEVFINPPSAEKMWRASGAWITGDFEMNWGYLRITNTSGVAFKAARFYAEYYDEAGRMCFTLAFSQDSNFDGAHGPFLPWETRTLHAEASVAPAVRPKAVRLWFLGEAARLGSSDAKVLAPATVRDSTWGKVEGIRLGKMPQALTPVALVEVVADTNGIATSTRVVAALNDNAGQWVRDLIPKLRFAPATIGEERVGQTTLILIRALETSPERTIPAAPPSDDLWVQSYLNANDAGGVLPMVNLLELRREPDSDLFQYFSIGTDWASGVFQWVQDPASPRMRRDWIPPVAQEMQ